MKEQFDKRLVEKIKASFEHHKEPFDPKEWDKLSKAYFKPKRKRWVTLWPFITAGIAASLLMILIYYPGQQNIENQLRSLSDSVSQEQEEDRIVTENGEKDVFQENVEPKQKGLEETIAQGKQMTGRMSDRAKEAGADQQQSKMSMNQDAKHSQVGKNDTDFSPVLDTSSLDTFIEKLEAELGENLSALTDVPDESIRLKGGKNDRLLMAEEEAQAVIDTWKAENEGNVFSDNANESKTSPLKLGLVVSPQANSNPVSGMNLGAGIMSEFSLSKKLKIDVGVAYARQSLTPQNTQPVRTTLMADAMTSSNFIGSSYELNFASLDIPVNLKYKVLEKDKTGLYLITGLSSMVYLDQNTVETVETHSMFRTNTAEGGFAFSQSVQQFSNVVTPRSGENTADLAGMLNLSFGYEYKLNNELFISFEPFYKLPLGNLTFVNQQFSIGGMNLRMNFNLKK